ncbi:uncharacterized protein MAM_06930 [Metarhizium album ARSEF 1941]|uniref:Uncharacterized protein n=1 Tax=Metarhizium album (strain ARSEF 1941) TaxID=1081103 RepID=A0A0B2WNJ3_METAS|nr:uncharacterized protein MAM_06930 [Metarhizium album ARSEF 1941]KHN95219.1 hypothetical protein MAM_06930 [Metarhizium album ARSEF 1941]
MSAPLRLPNTLPARPLRRPVTPSSSISISISISISVSVAIVVVVVVVVVVSLLSLLHRRSAGAALVRGVNGAITRGNRVSVLISRRRFPLVSSSAAAG